jgi:hypothetical protein
MISAEDKNIVAEKEAEGAVAEFLEMRAAILGRLSPEALRCVPSIIERLVEERKQKRKTEQHRQAEKLQALA